VLRVKMIALVLLLAGISGVAHATPATANTAETQCKGLPGVDFSGIQDAATQVMSAKAVEPTAAAPGYCKVQGYVSPVSWPTDPASIGFTRPAYPYPLQAKYKGSGDPNKAENYGPTK
jgi:hypothetical protein